MLSSRSSVARQPAEIRAYIEKLLLSSVQTLDEKIADLKAQFPDEEDLPSRSAMHRYGQKLERRLSAIRASTEAANMIRENAGDREDARSEALIAMIQSELFESIIELQEAGDEDMPAEKRIGLLSAAAKNIATLTRSSIGLKKYQEEIAATVRSELLAEQKAALEEMGAKAGVTDTTMKEIRAVLGIV